MPKEVINSHGFGSVAEALLECNMDTRALRTNTLLRKDEWKDMDNAILQEVRNRLVGVADLKGRGLVYNLANALATMQLEHETVSKMGRAQVSMDGEAQGQRDRMTFGLGYLPIPIVHQDYSLNARVLAASRLRKSKLDTTHAVEAAATVAEELERMLFLGANSFAYGDGTIYGYTDHPSRLTGNFTPWTDSSADPVQNIITMKQALLAQGFHGPFGIYISTAYETSLDKDYVSGYPKTVRERILEIGGVDFIHVADYLTTGAVVMVALEARTVRMVSGLPVNNVEWKVGGGMRTNYKVMTIDVPQIRTTKSGKCGVAHYTAS